MIRYFCITNKNGKANAMKLLFFIQLALSVLFTAKSQAIQHNTNDMDTNTIQLTVGGKRFTATLADNSSARALKELLEKGELVIEMEDYANMEKVGALPAGLPRNDKQISTSAGDLILYQGRYFVIYYDSNSWSLTRLGKIEGVTPGELKSALGKGNVTVKLSLE